MKFTEYHEGYKVRIVQNGNIDKYGDKIFSYRIISSNPIQLVRKYCFFYIIKAYEKEEMPNPFSNEIIAFRALEKINDKETEYIYLVKKHYKG